jgi:hypothetical protein
MNWFSKFLKLGTPQALTVIPKTWDDLVSDTQSRNGFTRERAVVELARRMNADALPIFLERLNDWVPEVRGAARGAIASFISEQYLGTWIASIEEVIALSRGKRANHVELLLRIKNLLATMETVAALRHAYPLAAPEIKRYIFDLELAVPPSDDQRYGAFLSAVLGNDVVVATAALESDAVLSPAHQDGLMLASCKSMFGAVRLRGLRKVRDVNLPQAANLLRQSCLDVNAGVRSFACANVRDDREQVIEELRLVLASGAGSRFRAAALDALCMFAVPDADVLCKNAQIDGASLVRYIAFSWAFKLSSQSARDPLVLPALRDISANVRRVATRNVKSGAEAPNVDELLQLLSENPRTLGALLSVATQLSPWANLTFMLKGALATPENGATAEEFRQALIHWEADMAHCYVRPKPEESRVLSVIWLKVKSHLPLLLRERLAYQLTAFQIAVA